MKTIDTDRNPGRWSEEGKDHFWRVFLTLSEHMEGGHFHHPKYEELLGFAHKAKTQIDYTIAWNAAWLSANEYDMKD